MFGALTFASAAYAAVGDFVTDPTDPLRAACRARLAEHMSALGIEWSLIDLMNTGENPDASQPFVDIDFPGGSESQYTFGAPGSNLYDERGQISIYLKTPLGAGATVRATAEAYATMLRQRFRNDRFSCADGTTVRVRAVSPLGEGEDEAGMWVEAIALGYQRFNIG